MTIDVSSLKNLVGLLCNDNKLTSLNLAGCSNLEYRLDCQNNKLTSLNLSDCTKLKSLNLSNNAFTSIPDLSVCKNLEELDISNSTFSSINLSGYSKLRTLNASNCNSLKTLVCSDNALETLLLNDCVALENLNCSNNNLTAFYAKSAGCTKLQKLYCNNNKISSLNVRGCTHLKELKCNDNQLASLLVPDLANLTLLYCGSNPQLRSLNITGCSELRDLQCNDSQLTELNISDCTELETLNCNGNQLSQLDVSKCTKLNTLSCSFNNLGELDLNSSSALTKLNCVSNKLSTLNLSNCSLLNKDDTSLLTQKPSGWVVIENADGYTLNFSDYISSLENILNVQGYNNSNVEINTSYQNGVATFASLPSEIRYTYATGLSDKNLAVRVMEVKQNLTLDLLTTTLPDAIVGVPYYFELEAIPRVPNLIWASVNSTAPGIRGLWPELGATDPIRGTPTEAGEFKITVQIKQNGRELVKSLPLHVYDLPNITTNETLSSGKVGVNYTTLTLEATGSTPIAWDLITGNLPNGMSLADGKITGTPKEGGTFNFTIRASNKAGNEEKSFTLFIDEDKPDIVTDSLLIVGKENHSYIQKLSASTSAIWTLVDGKLPAGLTVTKSGDVAGTSHESGTFTFTAEAANAAGVSTKTFTLVIDAVKPTITTSEMLPNGKVGVKYGSLYNEIEDANFMLLKASGTSDILWEVTNGNLPKGLSLDNRGEIFGTPEEAGTFEFEATATNSVGSDSKTFKVSIEEQNESEGIAITTDYELPYGLVGKNYTLQLSATGVTPITWEISSNTFVPWLSIDPNTGILSGIPTKTASAQFQVRATNESGAVNKTFMIATYVPPLLKTTSLSQGILGEAYNMELLSEGSWNITWSVSGLPKGLAVQSTTGISGGTALENGAFSNKNYIKGTPEEAGTFNVVITVKSDLGEDAKNLTLTVDDKINIADENKFPDSKFRDYLSVFDADADGTLTKEEIATVTYMDIRDKNISSLDGIEKFTALEELNCSNNNLTKLEFNSTTLKRLNCSNNQLTELNVSNLPSLEYLACYDNLLTNLDVTNNTKLQELHCDGNPLGMLDVSKNIALIWLDCNRNELTELDLSKNVTLEIVGCQINSLDMLDMSHNAVLKQIDCSFNELTSLDFTYNEALEHIECSANKLTELKLNNPVLFTLRCLRNQLSKLDLSQCVSLIQLHCDENILTELDVSNKKALTELMCTHNELTKLNVTSCDNLAHLYCSENRLEKLDVTQCPQLEYLDCSLNNIAILDLKNSSKLLALDCLDNKLTELDIRNCSLLELLDCRGNNLTRLDISNCPKLSEFSYDDEVEIIEEFIVPVITTATLPEGVVGAVYPEIFLEATGTKPIIWSWSGNSPSGLVLSENGKISGKPEAAGSFDFTVKAKNDAGENTKLLSIHVKVNSSTPAIITKPTITTGSLKSGIINTLYNADLLATGTTPITWSKGTTWPNWLALNSSTGLVSGTPTTAGTYSLEVIATNEAGSDTKALSIVIVAQTTPPSDEPENPTPPSNDEQRDDNPSEPSPSTSDETGTDSPSAGGNVGATPDLNNPSANNAKPEQIEKKEINGQKAGIYSETVQTTSLKSTEIREALGNKWSDVPLRSMETDIDQTDNRTDEEKEALLKEMTQNNDVLYIFVLRPMKPKQSGVFTFALPLPADMEVGDILKWNYKQSSTRAASVSDIITTDILTSASEEDAIFIDMATGKETKVVPESRAVSVSTYLEAGYEYEPAIMTISNTNNNKTSTGENTGESEDSMSNNERNQESSSGGGCSAELFGIGTLLVLFLKKKRA